MNHTEYLSKIGTEGGHKHKPGTDHMRALAALSWTPEARAKRLRSIQRAKERNNDFPRKKIISQK